MKNNRIRMKILALHGLRETPETSIFVRALQQDNEVVAPRIDPLHPRETWKRLVDIMNEEEPEIIMGFSLGGFFASTLPTGGKPITLFNPALDFIRMLKERRRPDLELIREYESLPSPPGMPLGIFATGDTRIGMRGLHVFRERYPEGEVRLIPGGHNLSLEEFKKESGT